MPSIPPKLFKFRTWNPAGKNRTRELLEEGAFYCPSPHELDDPHDTLLGAHATGSPLDMDRFVLLDLDGVHPLMDKYNIGAITELNEKTVTDPQDQKVLRAMGRRKSRRHTRIVCFSAHFGSELMWAFYAAKHTGICLVFDTDHEFFRRAKPVVYCHSPTDLGHFALEPGEDDELAFCKSLPWQFQEEWRLVFQGDEPKKMPFPKEKLTAVILGYRFLEQHRNDLQDVLMKANYRVDIWRVDRLPNTYDLGLMKVEEIGTHIASAPMT